MAGYILQKFSVVFALIFVICMSARAQATQTPIFLEVAKHPNGTVKYMNQADASRYCDCRVEDREKIGCTTAPHSARLPSARELALMSMSYGAKGIVDSCQPAEISEHKCALVSVSDWQGNYIEHFYFKPEGYQVPAELGIPTDPDWPSSPNFWSSSFALMNFDYMWVLRIVPGALNRYGLPTDRELVRCVVRY